MTFNELFDKAARLLMSREHSVKELRQKLSRFAEATLVNDVIERCLTDKYVSDERYAEAYIRSRARKGYGPNRIRQELAEKGVSSAVAEAALAASEEDWQALAIEVREKKFGIEAADSFELAMKIKNYLYRRGFDLK